MSTPIAFSKSTAATPIDRTVLLAALVAVVNMLGYGIVIPILYAYTKKFGVTDFQNGLLFAAFSVCQFIATPIIGRMSDKYGRRPMLLISIIGTAVSFVMMAFAPNMLVLFLARMLDGLTAGNVPVILAIISDTTLPEQRARAFGMVGSAFSLGFIFGPAISGLTVGFGEAVPFLIAAAITVLATVLAAYFLPETNKNMNDVKRGKLFDFGKLWHTLFDPNVGATFMISLVFFLAFACAMMYGFQPFTMHVLKLTTAQNALLFTLFGLIGFISQNLFVGKITKALGMKKAFRVGLIMTAVAFFLMYLSRSVPLFALGSIILALFNSVSQTLIPTILSQEADAKSQGTIMGLNASYQSIGMIFGPILGGVVATQQVTLPFLVGSFLVVICVLLSTQVLRPGIKKESAF